jgi:hypothetical protein
MPKGYNRNIVMCLKLLYMVFALDTFFVSIKKAIRTVIFF